MYVQSLSHMIFKLSETHFVQSKNWHFDSNHYLLSVVVYCFCFSFSNIANLKYYVLIMICVIDSTRFKIYLLMCHNNFIFLFIFFSLFLFCSHTPYSSLSLFLFLSLSLFCLLILSFFFILGFIHIFLSYLKVVN